MAATYTPISYITLQTTLSSVAFHNIPNTYTDLLLVCHGYGSAGDGNVPIIYFNEDTGTNYSTTNLGGNGVSISSARSTNMGLLYCGYTVGWTTNSNYRACTVLNIMNYSNTTTNKTVLIRNSTPEGPYPGTELLAGLWRSTAAINSIRISGNVSLTYAAGTTFSLYGIKAGIE